MPSFIQSPSYVFLSDFCVLVALNSFFAASRQGSCHNLRSSLLSREYLRHFPASPDRNQPLPPAWPPEVRAAICRPRSFSSRDPRTLNRHSRTRHQIFLGPFPLLFSPSAAQKRSAGALPVLSRVSTTSRPVKSRSAACLFDFLMRIFQ